jgi:hypothetical protein
MQKAEYESELKTGEGRHVINFEGGSSNIDINGVTVGDSGGDGIYIGAGNPSNISISNVICKNNRRNNITVISAHGLTINNVVVENANGTPPEAGIDIEPDYSYHHLKNIRINNVTVKDNLGWGISVGIGKMYRIDENNPVDPEPFDIKIDNVTIEECGNGGILVVGGYYRYNPEGTVEISNVDIRNSPTTGDVQDRTNVVPGVMIRKSAYQGWDRNDKFILRNIRGNCDIGVVNSKPYEDVIIDELVV